MTAGTVAGQARRRARGLAAGRPDFRAWKGTPVAILTVVLFLANSFLSPGFTSAYSMTSFFATYLPAICLAVGVSFAILVGGIDLSLGPVMGLAGIFTVLLASVGTHLFELGPNGVATECSVAGACSQGIPFVAAALLGVLVGSAFGAVNGIAIAYLRLQPLMATLSMGFVAGGISLWIFPKPGGQIPDGRTAGYTAARVPPLGLIIAAIVVALAYAVLRTPLGIHMRAVGSDRARAFAVGVNVPRTTLLAYVASGTLAGVAGVLFTLNVSSADPTLGATFTLNAVAGAVLGGTALRGGWAEPVGPALGAISLGLLNVLVVAVDIPVYYQQLVSGIAIVIGLAATQTFFNRKERVQ